MERPCQHEGGFAVDIGQRSIGGQPDHHIGAAEAHVIAVDRFEYHRGAVIAGRTHPDGDAGQAGDRLDDPHQLRWAKDAVVFAKPRREIGNPDRCALFVRQDRGDDRGVAHIFGGKVDHALEHDIAETLLLAARQQAGKDGIAVESRIAPPHDPRRRIHQRCRASVADDREIEPKIIHSGFIPPRSHRPANQSRRPADHRRCQTRLPPPTRPNSRSRRGRASPRTPTRR
jgi:hypothetical protein